MKEHSSSRRTVTIRSTLSASGPAGSSFETLRAFTPRAPRALAAASGSGSSLAGQHRLGVIGEREQARVEIDRLDPLELGGQSGVAASCSMRRFAINVAIPARCCAGIAAARRSMPSMWTSGSRRSPSASARRLTSRSTPRYSPFGKHGAKISSTARSRREATRIAWTRSMSDVSSTFSACAKSSSARIRTMRAPAAP
jgi:hypothetical protein